MQAPSGFFTKLVPVVVENFSETFPELKQRQVRVTIDNFCLLQLRQIALNVERI